jgi:hypothetical protein
MSVRFAVVATLRSKRFWRWMTAGIIIYLIPAAIRYATGNIIIPLMNWPGYWIDNFIPGNLSEKLFVNAFFPGAAGAIAGEVYISNYRKQPLTGKNLYAARFAGAMLFVTAWSAFQYWGYTWGIYLWFSPRTNLFESYQVFPINYLIAAASIFTPTVVYSIKNVILKNTGNKRKK